MPDVSAPIMVIRKRLATDEVSDPDFRTEDGVVQRTNDGGATWVDSPANDVRHADAWRLPPIVADDPRCQAAANMTRFLVNWFEELLPILAAAGSGWALLSTLILLFVVLGPFALVIIMLDVAATLLGIGATAIGAAFTTEVFDTLTCIFYCNISDDGQVSADDLANINAQVDDDIGGTAATVLHLIFALVGEVGVSNWGAAGDAPADCDACVCGVAYKWDFTVSNADWGVVADRGAGCCFGGLGFVSVYNFGGLGNTEIRIASPSQPGKTLTRYIVEYSSVDVPDQTGLAIAQPGGGYTFDAASGDVIADMVGTFIVDDGFWRLDIAKTSADAQINIKSLTAYTDDFTGLTGGTII